MKRQLNLIISILLVVIALTAACSATYAWFNFSSTAAQNYELAADGARIIMFDAQLSEDDIEGTLYPKKLSATDIAGNAWFNGLQYADTVHFENSMSYYTGETESSPISLKIATSAVYGSGAQRRDLITSGELSVSIVFGFPNGTRYGTINYIDMTYSVFDTATSAAVNLGREGQNPNTAVYIDASGAPYVVNNVTFTTNAEGDTILTDTGNSTTRNLTQEGNVLIFINGYMMMSPDTTITVNTGAHLTTVQEETSADLNDGTVRISVSIETDDIGGGEDA